MRRQYYLSVTLLALATVARGELPKDAVVLDSDLVWDPVSVESAAVSPDGQLIAYVSKGAIWTCNVAAGPPTKLTDLPDTITAFLSMPEYQLAREKFACVTPNAGYTPIPERRGQIIPLFSLAWTPSQDGVVYTLRHWKSDKSPLAAYRVMHTTLAGVTTECAAIKRDFTTTPDSFTSFRVTPDKKNVVISCFGVPLIWDTASNAPRATCYDYMLPSASSGRFLAVEIDTRQLVVLDDNLKASKRIDVVFDQDRRCDLFWSPDERFAIGRKFRSGMEPISDNCTVFRVNLESGERRELKNGIQRDRFLFTGNGGEVVRLAVTGLPPLGYGDGSYGAYLEITPDGKGPEREVIRFPNPGGKSNDWHKQFYPPVLSNSDGSLFLMALPREDINIPGFQLYLIDRGGKKWKLLPEDTSQFVSPCQPVAFADKDRVIMGRTATQLFSISVKRIQSSQEVTNEWP
jgi:hypothetical protein